MPHRADGARPLALGPTGDDLLDALIEIDPDGTLIDQDLIFGEGVTPEVAWQRLREFKAAKGMD